MNKPRYVILSLILLVLAVALGAAMLVLGGDWFHDASTNHASVASPEASTDTPAANPKTTPKDPPDTTLTVAVTGDILSHFPVTQASRDADGTYNLNKLLAEVQPYIERADLAFCHQEVPYGQPGQAPHGYPVFNAPMNWANGLVETGYDGCSTASNHSWDGAREGLEHTLDVLEQAGLGTTATRRDPAQTPWQMYEVSKGGRTIQVAQIAFTYGLNYEYVPEVANNPYLVEIDDPAQIVDYARQAREAGADVVIAVPHGGSEYVYAPTDKQREWARVLAESGQIDAYIGHHAHVPQPIELTPGGVNGDGMWTYFGTGNLLTSQRPSMGIGTQIETIAWLTFKISGPEDTPQVTADRAQWVPIVLDRGRFMPVPSHDFDGGATPPGSGLDTATVERYHTELVKVMGDQAQELTAPPAAEGEPARVKVLPRESS